MAGIGEAAIFYDKGDITIFRFLKHVFKKSCICKTIAQEIK